MFRVFSWSREWCSLTKALAVPNCDRCFNTRRSAEPAAAVVQLPEGAEISDPSLSHRTARVCVRSLDLPASRRAGYRAPELSSVRIRIAHTPRSCRDDTSLQNVDGHRCCPGRGLRHSHRGIARAGQPTLSPRGDNFEAFWTLEALQLRFSQASTAEQSLGLPSPGGLWGRTLGPKDLLPTNLVTSDPEPQPEPLEIQGLEILRQTAWHLRWSVQGCLHPDTYPFSSCN